MIYFPFFIKEFWDLMARKTRYNVCGRFYHVMLRGNDGQEIFIDDQDRCRMSFLLQEGTERFGHKIHSFCFMSNHIHLLIQLGPESLSKIIHNLAFRYTRYVNRRYERIGHLFQGRFKSILLDEEGYFSQLLRYIHLNPIAANIVRNLSEYRWNSHRAYLGLDHILWITTDYGLKKFGNDLHIARTKYLNYLQQDDKIQGENLFFEKGNLGILGDEAFALGLIKQVGQEKKLSIVQVLNIVCMVLEIDPIRLKSNSQERHLTLARGIVAMLSRNFTSASMREIGELLRKEESSISSLIKRLQNRYLKDSNLYNNIKEIEKKLSHLAILQA